MLKVVLEDLESLLLLQNAEDKLINEQKVTELTKKKNVKKKQLDGLKKSKSSSNDFVNDLSLIHI